MKLKFEDGTVREVEALDINVWNAASYGDGSRSGVVITAYPMYTDEDGFWSTDTSAHVFTADTNLDPGDWDDDWFGYSEDNTPAEFPIEVRHIVENVLKEISQ